jgi:excisionase family DNA binding protein
MMNASAGIPRLTIQRGYMENPPGTTNGWMSVKEVATFQGVPPKMVYRWVHLKRPLPVRREGRRVFISVEDLDDFLTARKPTSQVPEPETEPEDGKAASVCERAASAPRPAATGTSNPPAKPSSGGGQRELGQCESRGTPRIAVLASYQFMG